MFYPRILAHLCFIPRARHTALDVRNIFERRFKHLLLLRAMRTPVSAVHLRLLRRQALRKSVETAAALAQSEKDYGPKRSQNQQCSNDLAHGQRCWLRAALFPVFRHGIFLYHDVQGRRQHVQTLAEQGKHFAIDHDIHRGIELEINAPGLPPFRQRMVDVGAIIEGWQISD
jgi:hypothetical protein